MALASAVPTPRALAAWEALCKAERAAKKAGGSVGVASDKSMRKAADSSDSESEIPAEKSSKLFPLFYRRPSNRSSTSESSCGDNQKPFRKEVKRKRPGAVKPGDVAQQSGGIKRKRAYQSCLDLGQRDAGHKTCTVCGMLYAPGEPSDEKMHAAFHAEYVSGVRLHSAVPAKLVLRRPNDNDIIAVLPAGERLLRSKINAVLRVADHELGYVGDGISKGNERVYFYVQRRRIVACVTAVEIKEAFAVVPGGGGDSSDDNQPRSPSPQAHNVVWRQETPQPARCGIGRMWVLRQCRRQGMASALLDAARADFCSDGTTVSLRELAFSQPTPSGHQFAVQYTGRPDFLVYC